MKRFFKIGVGMSLVIPSFTAHAFLNKVFVSQNRSFYSTTVNVDNSQHIYVDTAPLTEALTKLTVSTNLLALTAEERKRLTTEYQLDRLGPAIGVHVGGAEAATFVGQYGIAGFQRVIEDRLFYLRTNQVLVEALGSAVTKSGLDPMLGERPAQEKLFSSPTVVPLLDYIRRNPQEGILSTFEHLSKSSGNPHLQNVRNCLNGGKSLTTQEAHDVLAAVVYASKQGLEGGDPPVDFEGLNYDNLSQNSDAMASIASSFQKAVQDAFDPRHVKQKINICKQLRASNLVPSGTGQNSAPLPKPTTTDPASDEISNKEIREALGSDQVHSAFRAFSGSGQMSIDAGINLVQRLSRIETQQSDMRSRIENETERYHNLVMNETRDVKQRIASLQSQIDQKRAEIARREKEIHDEVSIKWWQSTWRDDTSQSRDYWAKVNSDTRIPELKKEIGKLNSTLDKLELEHTHARGKEFLGKAGKDYGWQDFKTVESTNNVVRTRLDQVKNQRLFVLNSEINSFQSQLRELLKKDGYCDFMERVQRGQRLIAMRAKTLKSAAESRGTVLDSLETQKGNH